jgi:hypothetical protein
MVERVEPTKGGYYLWNYLPSMAAAVIFILLFMVTTGLIWWRMFRTKTWFCTPFVVGGFRKLRPSGSCDEADTLIIVEFAGYCARASAHSKTGSIMPFAVQNVFMGNDGYLLRHEWTMYIFDSVPMFAVTILYYLWYPTILVDMKTELQNISA